MNLSQNTPRQITLPELKERENIKVEQVNNYSNFDYVKLVEEALGAPLFSRLKNTFLGPIIDAASRSSDGSDFSGKAVYLIMSRYIKTEPRNDELWFHFGGQPMRFSLREYFLVTGLPCAVSREEEDGCNGPFIDTSGDNHKCADLLDWIKSQPDDAEDCKLRLGMLLILESVFLIKYSVKNCTFANTNLNRARDSMMVYAWEGTVSRF
ncbi:hypothetical protein V5N11_002520 [Cardamine amara subsp. amara]|uniref:DUF1985 domain-containing protein n=1 Tax=Cardamine amara subsp. amara TaxID=228776 RepID=A0ABD1AHB8_CARAN